MAMSYGGKVTTSVAIFMLSVCAIPIYNKKVFSGGVAGLNKFPYPIATAFMQLGAVTIALALINITGHFLQPSRRADSWLLGPHFLYKIRNVLPLGMIFGLKYGMTNWGLALVPTGTHLLLQSTELIWTVASARLWNKEKLSLVDVVAALLATAGSVLISLRAGQTIEAPVLPVLVNMATPLVLALSVSSLRSGAKELFRPDNVLRGTVSPGELTCLKLLISTPITFLLSLILENGVVVLTPDQDLSWWTALSREPALEPVFLIGGALPLLIFQTNMTWLAGLTSAVSVGIVAGVKVAPQWAVDAALLGKGLDLSPLNVGGAVLVVAASCLYAVSRGCKQVRAASVTSDSRLLSHDSNSGLPALSPTAKGDEK